MLPSGRHQCQSPKGNKGHPQVAWCLRTTDVTSGDFWWQLLEEFVDGEAEPDHRERSPDPCHQCSFRRDDRAVEGQIGSLLSESRCVCFLRSCSRCHREISIRLRSSRASSSASESTSGGRVADCLSLGPTVVPWSDDAIGQSTAREYGKATKIVPAMTAGRRKIARNMTHCKIMSRTIPMVKGVTMLLSPVFRT
jgi:hypothetical protein